MVLIININDNKYIHNNNKKKQPLLCVHLSIFLAFVKVKIKDFMHYYLNLKGFDFCTKTFLLHGNL